MVLSACPIRPRASAAARLTLMDSSCSKCLNFGVMSLLASEPSPDKYTAMGECQVLEFKQSALESIFNEHPELMKEMADFLAKQKFQRMAKLSALTQSDKKQRGDRSLRRYGKEFLALIQKSFSEE